MGWGFLNFACHAGRSGGASIAKFLTRDSLPSAAMIAVALAIASFADISAAMAQTAASGVVASGNAVVTGFSGALPPSQIAPGQDPGDLTFIDPSGPSLQIFNLQSAGAPPQAQVVGAPVSLTVTASQIGQVFGVALDNATPPNIYAAASSAYGLPIIVRDKDGSPERAHNGAFTASFAAGLFGPAVQGGGPGSIWRIDGASGAVTLFVNVTLNSAVNAGPALGGLAFDPVSNSLFVADRQTGMIHRFNLSGQEVGRFDHGVQGLTAVGQVPVAYAPNPLDITKAQFSSDKPETWHFAPPQRRVFGLAVHAGRLYYAVTFNLQIWSVAIAPDGSFGSDARIELQVPPAAGPTEIAKIAFDDQGDMILAERAVPTGDYELATLAQAGIGRVLRYAAAPTGGWLPPPGRYAVGFPDPNTSANGGVAVGYGYDANGNLDLNSCGGSLWSTGEQLRNTADARLAAVLAGNGPVNLNGLQGSNSDLVVPANAPPQSSLFIDYDAQFDSPAVHGYLGDIAIPRTCGQAGLQSTMSTLARLLGGAPGAAAPVSPQLQASSPSQQQSSPSLQGTTPLTQLTPPSSSCANGQCSCSPGTGQVCCAEGTLPGAGGQCQTACPQGQSDPNSEWLCMQGFSPVPDANGNAVCLNNIAPNPSIPFSFPFPATSMTACISQSPFANPANCPTGSTFQSGTCQFPSPPTCPNNQAGLPAYSYQVSSAQSQQLPQCPPSGPTTPGPPSNTPPPQGSSSSCPNGQCGSGGSSSSCPNGQCACSPQPGVMCCPPQNFLNSGGQCQPLCPKGQTDQTSIDLCFEGVNPTPINNQYTCLDGTPASPQPIINSSGVIQSSPTNCFAQSPFANTAVCPLGMTPTAPPSSIPGVQTLCQPTGSPGPQCPSGGVAYSVSAAQSQQLSQCPPSGMTAPNPPATTPSTPPPAACQQGETQYCVFGPNQTCQTGQFPCCPSGSQLDPAGSGQCVPTGPSCDPASYTVCCANGSCRQAGVCQAGGGSLYCATGQNGQCPSGTTPYNGSCLAQGLSCPNNIQVCCQGNTAPNFNTGSCCPPTQTVQSNGSCGCSPNQLTQPNGACSCPPGQTVQANGLCGCSPNMVPSGQGCSCAQGFTPNLITGQCVASSQGSRPTTEPPGNACGASYKKLSSRICCLAAQVTSKGQCCPAGQSPNDDGACKPIEVRTRTCATGQTLNLRTNKCETPPCAAGLTRDATGLCGCRADQELNRDTGKCVARRDEKPNPPPSACPTGWEPTPPTGQCCPPHSTVEDGVCRATKRTEPEPCPYSGQVRNDAGVCVCPPGLIQGQGGACVQPCLFGQVMQPNGSCTCPNGQAPGAGGVCSCPPSQILTPGGTCTCQPGQKATPNGTCIDICPAGQSVTQSGLCCATSQITKSGKCCLPGQAPQPDGECAPASTPGQSKTQSPNNPPAPACAAGYKAMPNGSCCPDADVRDGECVTPPTPSQPPTATPVVPAPACAAGYSLGADQMCHRIGVGVVCPPHTGEIPAADGRSCVCPSGATLGPTGACQCMETGGNLAPPGGCGPKLAPCLPPRLTPDHQCCPPGTTAQSDGSCSANCPLEMKQWPDGTCSACPPGQQLEPNGNCGPILTPPPGGGGCLPGQVPNPQGGCMPGLVPLQGQVPLTQPPPTTPRPCAPGVPPGTAGCFEPPTLIPLQGRTNQNNQPTPTPPRPCQPGVGPGTNGCVATPPRLPPCEAGESRIGDGPCRPYNPQKPPCEAGEERNADGACVKQKQNNENESETKKPSKIETPKIETPKIETPKIAPKPPAVKLPAFRPPPPPPPPPSKFNLPLFKHK